ncbi:MAG: coiled-coil domain-containing protein [Chitinophagales bacterium]
MNLRYQIRCDLPNKENSRVAVEFLAKDLKINLFAYDYEDLLEDKLDQWINLDPTVELPVPFEEVVRDSKHEHLLPEHWKTRDAGKVRQIELNWATLLVRERLLSVYTQEVEHLESTLAQMDAFDRQHFEACKAFWDKFFAFAKENHLPRSITDEFKARVDVMFDVLKALRKEDKRKLEIASVEGKKNVLAKIEEVTAKIEEGKTQRNVLFNELKAIHELWKQEKLTKSDRNELKATLDAAFDKVKNSRRDEDMARNSKRIDDLNRIVGGVTKALERVQRNAKYHREALEKTDQVFQMKLHETKLRMLEEEIAEIAKKKADIEKTLSKLKKQMARNEPSPSGKEAPKNNGEEQEDTKKPSKESKPAESVPAEESTGESSQDVAPTNTSVQESSDKSQPAED